MPQKWIVLTVLIQREQWDLLVTSRFFFRATYSSINSDRTLFLICNLHPERLRTGSAIPGIR